MKLFALKSSTAVKYRDVMVYDPRIKVILEDLRRARLIGQAGWKKACSRHHW
jgi:hypothetical protein